MELDEIYRQYFQTVYRYALSLSRDPDTAEEVAQETFFKALKKIDGFKGECSVQTWLCSIAKNTYFSMAAKQKNKEKVLEEQSSYSETTQESFEDSLIEKDEGMRLHRILHRLREPYKEVVMLRLFSELSFREIADLFGKSESWARITFMRGRRMIKEEAENEN